MQHQLIEWGPSHLRDEADPAPTSDRPDDN